VLSSSVGSLIQAAAGRSRILGSLVAGLYFAGHVSDYLGRRRVILMTVAVELLSAIMFVLLKDTASLLVARFVCGIGIGALSATATVHLAELHAVARPGSHWRFSGTVATAVNTGGLSLGPLIAGALVEWLPAPLTLSYAVFVVLWVQRFHLIGMPDCSVGRAHAVGAQSATVSRRCAAALRPVRG